MRYQLYTPAGDMIGEADTAQAIGDKAYTWLETIGAPFCYAVDYAPSIAYRYTRYMRTAEPLPGLIGTQHATLTGCLYNQKGL